MPTTSTLVPPTPLIPRPDSVTACRLAASMLLRAGIDASKFWPSDPVIALCNEQAEPRKFIEVCRTAALEGGYSRAEMTNPHECIRAAMSTAVFSDAWSATMGAVILDAWLSERDTTQLWTTDGETKSYKPEPRIGLGAGEPLAPAPRGGQARLAHAPSENTTSQQVRKYARRIEIDEQDILSDNLEIYQRLAEDAGKAAGRLRPDLCYSILAANPTMADGDELFCENHGNLASSTLSIDAVSAGMQAIGKQQVDGTNLHLTASVLLVPPAMEGSAAAIARNLVVGQNAPLTVVTEPRIENGVTDPATGTAYPGSATAWYLAVPRSRTIEIAYLDGIQTPQTKEYPLAPGQWGLGLVTWISVGAVALDHRALYRGNV